MSVNKARTTEATKHNAAEGQNAWVWLGFIEHAQLGEHLSRQNNRLAVGERIKQFFSQGMLRRPFAVRLVETN
jgi:hypothetical protein